MGCVRLIGSPELKLIRPRAGAKYELAARENPAKEEALRRLSEPEGDHELHTALERRRLDHPHLWGVLRRLHLAHDADPAKLEAWRRAPEGSREDTMAAHYDEAMRVLQMSLQ